MATPTVTRPTLWIDEQRVRRNISRMVQRAATAQVSLRPHFKTHQCATIGRWCREAGVDRITVSSLEMAAHFAAHGWDEITVAFPCNVAQMPLLQELASRIRLGVLVDSQATVRQLHEHLCAPVQHPVQVWVKIDVGYARAGVPWNDASTLKNIVSDLLDDNTLVQFAGLLTHAGHSYDTHSRNDLVRVSDEGLQRMHEARDIVAAHTTQPFALSSGDTPSMSADLGLEGVDEIRPGNFVFHDVMQLALGSCAAEEIGVAVACPIVACYPHRNEVLVYGGACHFSKDFLAADAVSRLPGIAAQQDTVYGLVVESPPEAGASWGDIRPDAVLTRISQEHGIVEVSDAFLEQCRVGNPLYFLPVHSCLTTDLYPAYRSLQGERLERFRTNDPA